MSHFNRFIHYLFIICAIVLCRSELIVKIIVSKLKKSGKWKLWTPNNQFVRIICFFLNLHLLIHFYLKIGRFLDPILQCGQAFLISILIIWQFAHIIIPPGIKFWPCFACYWHYHVDGADYSDNRYISNGHL